MVCVPERRLATPRVAPVPRSPSRLEAQWMAPLRSPSSVSLASPASPTVSPGLKTVPSAGAAIVTTGRASTRRVRVAVALFPSWSVTAPVIVCGPRARVPTASVSPWPSVPATSSVQVIVSVRVPSSVSEAVAARSTVSPVAKTLPSAGPVIAMVGAASTAISIAALAVLPPLSCTVAMTACVPERRLVVVRRRPVPRSPSRLSDQAMFADRSASSGSEAVPMSSTVSPGENRVPVAGVSMVRLGPPFTRSSSVARPVLPPRSVTEAVTMCVPEWRARVVIVAPAPRGPSRFELQVMALARSPSSVSEAVAVKVMASPELWTDPLAGSMIRMVGSTLTSTVIDVLTVRPVVSATVAVMVWLPARSVPVVTDRPEAAVEARGPADGGPLAGALIVTTGGAFSSRTRIVTRASPTRPWASVTAAVSVCVPMPRAPAVTAEPTPSAPSRLDDQRICCDRSPSSTSVAAARSTIGSWRR